MPDCTITLAKTTKEGAGGVKVFISWSGTTSRLVAEVLSDWLPKVIQGIEPFVSAKDIDKGANWTVELARELEDADFGIVCLAPDNLLSPWLNYETGAITKSVNSRVCPVLFGVEKGDINPPMSQLQLTSAEKDDFLLLMGSMNKVAGEPVGTEALKEAVDVWWPRLEKGLKAIVVPKLKVSPDATAAEPAKPAVDINEMLEEILQRMRRLDDRVRRLDSNSPIRSTMNPRFAEERSSSGAVRFLSSALSKQDIEVEDVVVGSAGIDIFVAEVPTTLADETTERIRVVAKKEKARVRIISPDRTLIFEGGGGGEITIR